MRPSFPHPIREQRHTRRRRRGHGTRASEAPAQAALVNEAPLAAPTGHAAGACDPAAQRVREAGGPVDRASYSCSCGYLFSASVSTSVSCPHCGAGQAW
jgi:hypothetical protein